MLFLLFGLVMEDIKAAASSFESVSFVSIRRDANNVAHVLAKWLSLFLRILI